MCRGDADVSGLGLFCGRAGDRPGRLRYRATCVWDRYGLRGVYFDHVDLILDFPRKTAPTLLIGNYG